MNNYTKQWSSATPGYLIFLVDQSGSMKETYIGAETRAEFLAKAINKVIQTLIIKNTSGDKTKDRVFISLIGYGGLGGNSVVDLRSDYLSKFADEPLRIDKVRKSVPDGAGGLVEIEDELLISLDPLSPRNGLTPMAGALECAKNLVEAWIQEKPDNPAPVIINVTDGIPYNGNLNKPNEESENAYIVAKQIMSIQTGDGSPLIFNVHIENNDKEIQFPENVSELSSDTAKFLFNISSRVPNSYKADAQKLQLNIRQNSLGFIANADAVSLIKFINFGSSGGMQDMKL